MIELTENEMKSLDLEFRTRASRLCQSKYQEVMNLLDKFIGYVERTPTLAEYVRNCNAVHLRPLRQHHRILRSPRRCVLLRLQHAVP